MLANASALVPATVTEQLAGGRFRVRIADGSLFFVVASTELAERGRIFTGDRVSVIPPAGDVPGLIVGFEPAESAAPSAPPPFSRRANHLSPEKLKIDRTTRPDWPTGADRTPAVGEVVHCTEGPCTVVRVLGRTGNGSRLLELRLEGVERRPFFAAASNVLVHPETN